MGDTLLITENNESMTLLVHRVERISGAYGLKLNRGKCNKVSIDENEELNFISGEVLNQAIDTEYLGSDMNDKARADKINK